MKLNLNQTLIFSRTTEALDAVDEILARQPVIDGLLVQPDIEGFTYTDADKNYTLGVRMIDAESQDRHYRLTTVMSDSDCVQHTVVSRLGHMLVSDFKTAPWENVQALDVMVSLRQHIALPADS